MKYFYEEHQQPGNSAEAVPGEAFLESQQSPARVESEYHLASADLHLLKEREDGLDSTLSETFPCSDPLSSIPNPTSRSL
jgi:hypothetical protein